MSYWKSRLANEEEKHVKNMIFGIQIQDRGIVQPEEILYSGEKVL